MIQLLPSLAVEAVWELKKQQQQESIQIFHTAHREQQVTLTQAPPPPLVLHQKAKRGPQTDSLGAIQSENRVNARAQFLSPCFQTNEI